MAAIFEQVRTELFNLMGVFHAHVGNRFQHLRVRAIPPCQICHRDNRYHSCLLTGPKISRIAD